MKSQLERRTPGGGSQRGEELVVDVQGSYDTTSLGAERDDVAVCVDRDGASRQQKGVGWGIDFEGIYQEGRSIYQLVQPVAPVV